MNQDSSYTKQQTVIGRIEEWIATKKISPGEKLPSERELMNLCGYSRVTIRAALKSLTERGTIEKVHGKGNFVRRTVGRKYSVTLIYSEKEWQVPGAKLFDFGNSYLLSGFLSANPIVPTVNLCYLHPDAQSLRESLDILLSYESDGFIITSLGGYGEIVRALGNAGEICVVRNYRDEGCGGYCLWADLREAFRKAALEALLVGRRTVVFLGDPDENDYHRIKLEGVRQAVEEAGLNPHNLRVLLPKGNFELDAFRAVRAFHAEGGHADLFVCSTDLKAFGALAAIRESGRRVPEDTAIFGTDNLAECQSQSPPLSSIGYPYHEMGRKMFDIFEQRFANPGEISYSQRFECPFIRRTSC